MSYFRELPNILYQSNLLHKVSSREYVAIKNIFRRVKIRDDVTDQANFYKKYVILDGQRPDTVAEEFYGAPDLDWVVVLTAGITNIKDQWPLGNYDLYRYGIAKYGLENLYKTHHFETTEVRDHRNRMVMPAGQKVDQNFTISSASDIAEPYVGINPLSNNVLYNGGSFGSTPNNGTIWSKNLAGTQNPAGRSVRNIFDGDILTEGSTSGQAIFTPPTPIPFNEKIEVYVSETSASNKYVATINGEQQSHITLSGGAEWKTVYSGGGTLDKLTIINSQINTANVFLNAIKIDGYIMRDNNIGPVVAVTNYDYETKKNESNREINLLKPVYLQQYLREIREIMTYDESSMFINNKLITTENTRLIGP